MYEDYKISCQEEDRKVYSYITYWRIIKEMNISFAKLGTEECEVCDTYRIHRDYKKQETNGHTSPQRDTAEMVRKKTRKETDNEEFIECSRICDVCSAYKANISERYESRQDYVADKELATTDNSTFFLSADLQKFVLLPRMLGYKKCIFTFKLIAFNMTFARIGKKNSSKAQGVLWHESICGRKDEDISSAY